VDVVGWVVVMFRRRKVKGALKEGLERAERLFRDYGEEINMKVLSSWL
jgi:hypothetical protein